MICSRYILFDDVDTWTCECSYDELVTTDGISRIVNLMKEH